MALPAPGPISPEGGWTSFESASSSTTASTRNRSRRSCSVEWTGGRLRTESRGASCCCRPAVGSNSLVRQRVAAFTARSQLVHADLPGNVLFHPHLPPLVIDVSPYWCPPRFAAGAIVAGALVWEGAGDQLLESLQWVADDAQLLLRALLFRAVTDLLHRPHEEPTIVTRPCQPALELALRLAGPDVALPHNPARTASSTSRQTSITWPSRESFAAEDPSRGVPPVTEVRRSSPAGHGRLRFAVTLLRGLPAGPEHGRDLGPGVSVVSGRGNGVGKFHLGSRSGTDRGSKAPQMRRVSVRGRDRCRIQGVEPPLGVIGGLLQLCAGAGHGHHLVVWSRAGSQLFVELAAEGHRVDGHRFAVVVEDDDFEEPARTVSTDVEIAVSLVDDAYGVADGVFNVGAVDAVLAGGVRDLHPCRLPCPFDWTT